MAMPADAPSNPASQPGALSNLPLSYSSGYSPMCQTFPSLSCAKKASSASTSSPSEQSLSQTTTVFTPFISLVKSVTVVTTRREMRSPLSMADPSNTECAPGSRGNHLLSTVVELSKLVRAKSFALTVLRCSDWVRSEFSCVPDSELVPAQAGAENTKSNAAVAKRMRRDLTFSPPFSLLHFLYCPAGSTPTSDLSISSAATRFPLIQISSSSLRASALFSSADMNLLRVVFLEVHTSPIDSLSSCSQNHPP